jgi:DNA-binding NarL/FixJ family response regulator
MLNSEAASGVDEPAIIAVFDHRLLVRTLLREALERKLEGAFVVDHSCHAAFEPGEGGETLPVRLVLLSVPEVDAAVLASEREVLASRHPGASVVLLSDCDDADFVEEALDIGYRGVISTATPLDIVVIAVQLVLAGGVYCPRRVRHPAMAFRALAPPATETARPAQAQQVESERLCARLTAREIEVMGEICRGSPNKIIARVLSISENTAKMHVRRIISKLRVRNRVEAALLFQAQREPTDRRGNRRHQRTLNEERQSGQM